MPLAQGPPLRISGIMTFARAPVGDLEDLKEGVVAVAGVPYDLASTGRFGARYGPNSIREGAAYIASVVNDVPNSGAEDPLTGMRLQAPTGKIFDLGDMDVYPLDWPKTESALRREMCQIARIGATPLILGGDHMVSSPLALGYSDAVRERGGRKIGYIQFSSQLDLGDEDPLWGSVWRGSTAKRILDSGVIDKANMVWVGVHGYVPQSQMALAEDLNLRVFTLDDVRRDGIQKVTKQALEEAGAGCDSIYVSVDINSVDGAYMPGVDTPSFRGMRNIDLIKAVDILGKSKTGALDIVGVNPIIEQAGQGAITSRFGAWLGLRYIAPRIMEKT